MELFNTEGIVSTEVRIQPTDDLRAWLCSRERRQSEHLGVIAILILSFA